MESSSNSAKDDHTPPESPDQPRWPLGLALDKVVISCTTYRNVVNISCISHTTDAGSRTITQAFPIPPNDKQANSFLQLAEEWLELFRDLIQSQKDSLRQCRVLTGLEFNDADQAQLLESIIQLMILRSATLASGYD
ncbi:MAG: hypothetical protein [Trichoderma harzianum mononegavirus 1]|nr:MAG: hypothetical protein [Trichoderma harzianum mononegavirus 1]